MKRIISSQLPGAVFGLQSPQSIAEVSGWMNLPPDPKNRPYPVYKQKVLQTLNPQKFQFMLQHLTERWVPTLAQFVNEVDDLSGVDGGFVRNYYNEDEDETYGQMYDEMHTMLTSFFESEVAGVDATGVQEKWRQSTPIEDLVEEFSRMLNHEMEYRVGQHFIQSQNEGTYYIRIYGVRQGYGGPEEGGWYYDHKELVDTEVVQGLQNALNRHEQLSQQLEGKGDDTFNEDMVSGHGGIREMDETDEDYPDLSGGVEQEGMIMNPGWTTSGFRRYTITIETGETPRNETTQRPHYE